MTTTVTVSEEVITLTEEIVETITITTAEQGPPGIQGEAGFTTGIDIISGGNPDTDYTNEYQFDGGTP
jgi:hypothetical protein